SDRIQSALNGRREGAQIAGLRRSADRDRRSPLDLGNRRRSQHFPHLRYILDLDGLGTYIRQRLLLVLQLLLLLPLLRGLLALLVGSVHLLVELLKAFVDLVDGRFVLIGSRLC